MIAYQSITLRYLHDPATGEFANLGVVVYSPGHPVESRFTHRLQRVSRFFGGIETHHIRAILTRLEKALAKAGGDQKQIDFIQTGLQIREIATRALAQDSSALQWADAGAGTTDSLPKAADNLLARLVTRYEQTKTTNSRTSEVVWDSYCGPLASKGVLRKLTPRELITPNYTHHFDHTFINGCLRVIEPVSLDYDDPDYIVARGRHWLGVGAALQKATEEHRFTFLLGLPSTSEGEKAADKAVKLMEMIDSSVDFVRESEAKRFATNLAAQING